MFTRIASKSVVFKQFGKSALNRPIWAQSCGHKTKTIGLFGDEVKECLVETSIKPADFYLNPSTPEKIYPTTMDEYLSIPVVVNGKEIVLTLDEIIPPPPEIYSIVHPGHPMENSEDVVPSKPGETMADYFQVFFAQNMPTIHDEKNPERDLVNFPTYGKRVVPAIKYRLYIFPEWWFKAFESKTGVSGPYVALSSISLFLISKEYFVVDHSVPPGIIFMFYLAAFLKLAGPKIKERTIAGVLKTQAWWEDWRVGMIKILNNYIEHCHKQISLTKDMNIFYDALRENIKLQQEAVYRKRLSAIYQEAQKKLNLQVALDNAKEQYTRRHMVNWILDSVNKAITPDKEKLIFDQCLSDLKALAERKAGAI